MSVLRRPLRPGVLLSLSLALAGCGWEVPPVDELPPLVLSPDAGTPGRPPPTTPTMPTGPVPSAPTILAASAGDGVVTVRWSAASGNGRSVLSYQVELRPENFQGATYTLMVPSEQTEVTFWEVIPGVPYAATVRATSEVGTGPASSAFGNLVPYVGSCGTVYSASGWSARSGVHRITLGGTPVDVYCLFDSNTGPWTLVLHSAFTGQSPTNPRLYQSLAEWRAWGVGAASQFEGHRGSAPYVMPLDAMRALLEGRAGFLRVLRVESDSNASLAQLYGASMGNGHALSGYNASDVSSLLCGSPFDCFLYGPLPFSTPDSATSGSSCASQNQGLGWWYGAASCGLHHPFRTDSRLLFSERSADPTTNHWTWWVQ